MSIGINMDDCDMGYRVSSESEPIVGKCGMTWEKHEDIISGHYEVEPMTLCGESTCSDECWKSWSFCPYCGKPFVIPKNLKTN